MRLSAPLAACGPRGQGEAKDGASDTVASVEQKGVVSVDNQLTVEPARGAV
jgi:hypothetical protein